MLKQLLAKRFKKLKKKRPELYEDLLRFYRLLCKVIDSSPEGETGIPLGNVSSQDFANIVLNEVDQYCIRFLGAKLYTRYMDDIIIIAPSKETAREWLAIGNPLEEFPEWAQPLGANDAYHLGDKVTHDGKRWVCSQADGAGNNTWVPGVYGWTEYVEPEEPQEAAQEAQDGASEEPGE